MKHCTIEGCLKTYKCSGYCAHHYDKYKRPLDPCITLGCTLRRVKNKRGYCDAHFKDHQDYMGELCMLDGCVNKRHYSDPKLCSMHYQRLFNPYKMSEDQKFYHHGLQDSIEYHVWNGMKQRCFNQNHHKYPIYGGRGIKVCERWLGLHGFENFLKDMGKRPSLKHSIDRKDNDGNYEPDNCRWATAHQQAANKSTNGEIVGVNFSKKASKWRATLKVNKKQVLHEYYHSKQEAIAARKAAEKEYGIVL